MTVELRKIRVEILFAVQLSQTAGSLRRSLKKVPIWPSLVRYHGDCIMVPANSDWGLRLIKFNTGSVLFPNLKGHPSEFHAVNTCVTQISNRLNRPIYARKRVSILVLLGNFSSFRADMIETLVPAAKSLWARIGIPLVRMTVSLSETVPSRRFVRPINQLQTCWREFRKSLRGLRLEGVSPHALRQCDLTW